MNDTKNLTKEPPRSLRQRLGGFAVAARMIDKGRADIAGVAGEYHFGCPLDQSLFEFKGVQADEVKAVLASGVSDHEVVDWLNGHGTPKTTAEIEAWSAGVDAIRPYFIPERKEWFTAECAALGLQPETSSIADYLDADDVATFKQS